MQENANKNICANIFYHLIYTKKDDRSRLFWVTSGARTHDTRNHNPMLCQLSYSHHIWLVLKPGAKVLLFFDMTKYFAKKMSRKLFLLIFFCIRSCFFLRNSSNFRLYFIP